MEQRRTFIFSLAFVIAIGMIALMLGVVQTKAEWLSSESKAVAEPQAEDSFSLGPWRGIYYDGNWGTENEAPVIAYNSLRNEYLAVWEKHNPNEITIQGRLFNSSLTVLGSELTIASYSTYTSCQPTVAYSSGSNTYLVGLTIDSKPSLPPYHNYNIHTVPVDYDGTVGTIFSIRANSNNQLHPSLTYNSAWDEFLIVWEEEQGTGGMHDIWAQRINASDFSLEPGPVNIDNSVVYSYFEPDVAYNASDNGYLVAYAGNAGADGDIYGKTVPADLANVLASPNIAIINNTNNQNSVAVASGQDGYLAVWQDGPSAGHRTIYARKVVSETVKTPNFPFLIYEITNRICSDPDIAFGLGYLVAWVCDENVTGENTRGISVFADASGVNGSAFYYDNSLYRQIQPALACAIAGECAFVQTDNSTTSDSGNANLEIYGRLTIPRYVYLPLIMKNFLP